MYVPEHCPATCAVRFLVAILFIDSASAAVSIKWAKKMIKVRGYCPVHGDAGQPCKQGGGQEEKRGKRRAEEEEVRHSRSLTQKMIEKFVLAVVTLFAYCRSVVYLSCDCRR
jgi:hypothetical protein